jgi:L-lactate dehydrogenase
MNHGLPFLNKTKVWAGSYADCTEADIIIITAGASQKPGENRIDLLKRNVVIFESITAEILKHNNNAILLIASNPVDIMSYFTWKKSGWPVERIIGSGTLLDSARLRYLIGEKLQLDTRSIHAHIIGEHGDSELPLWSLANVAGTPVNLSETDKAEVFDNTKNAAYQIISRKGATYYAIALALDRICTAILDNEASVLNVSTLLTDYQGVSDVFLGVPCVIDRNGVREVLGLKINDLEREQLNASADKLKEIIKSIGV